MQATGEGDCGQTEAGQKGAAGEGGVDGVQRRDDDTNDGGAGEEGGRGVDDDMAVEGGCEGQITRFLRVSETIQKSE